MEKDKKREKKEMDRPDEKKLDLETLKNQLKNCLKEKEEYLAGWQRARADLLNYKKEEMERIENLISYAREELILKILPVLDNFELTEKKITEDLKNNEYIKGILQIKAQLKDFLKNQGVEEIKSLGKKFDPNFHEVVEEVSAESLIEIEGKVKESDVIVEEVQKGYMINDHLLRPAKVKVLK